jgi:hypothetical protein
LPFPFALVASPPLLSFKLRSSSSVSICALIQESWNCDLILVKWCQYKWRTNYD